VPELAEIKKQNLAQVDEEKLPSKEAPRKSYELPTD